MYLGSQTTSARVLCIDQCVSTPPGTCAQWRAHRRPDRGRGEGREHSKLTSLLFSIHPLTVSVVNSSVKTFLSLDSVQLGPLLTDPIFGPNRGSPNLLLLRLPCLTAAAGAVPVVPLLSISAAAVAATLPAPLVALVEAITSCGGSWLERSGNNEF